MALVDRTWPTLQQQAKTPANQVMTATRPTVSQTAKVLERSCLQGGGGALGAAGLLLALLLCLLVDRLGAISARSRRNGRRHRCGRRGGQRRGTAPDVRGRTVPADPDAAPPSPAPDVEPGDGAAPPAPTAAADDVADVRPRSMPTMMPRSEADDVADECRDCRRCLRARRCAEIGDEAEATPRRRARSRPADTRRLATPGSVARPGAATAPARRQPAPPGRVTTTRPMRTTPVGDWRGDGVSSAQVQAAGHLPASGLDGERVAIVVVTHNSSCGPARACSPPCRPGWARSAGSSSWSTTPRSTTASRSCAGWRPRPRWWRPVATAATRRASTPGSGPGPAHGSPGPERRRAARSWVCTDVVDRAAGAAGYRGRGAPAHRRSGGSSSRSVGSPPSSAPWPPPCSGAAGRAVAEVG